VLDLIWCLMFVCRRAGGHFSVSDENSVPRHLRRTGYSTVAIMAAYCVASGMTNVASRTASSRSSLPGAFSVSLVKRSMHVADTNYIGPGRHPDRGAFACDLLDFKSTAIW